jgi:predicted transcriptional regulator of viral defense system
MLRYLGAPYYVGLLTAAAQHGASGQAAQEVQVIVDRQIRQKIAGRQRIEFILSTRASQAPVVEVTTPTGGLRVSTPEMTMLDLVAYPSRAAGWSNIASLLPELARLSSRRGWKEALRVEPRATEVQRLGHLLDRFSAPHTDALAAWLEGRPYETTKLVPGGGTGGPRDARWRVIVNATIEPD